MTAEQHRPFIEALLSATADPKAGWLDELMAEDPATLPYALGMREGRATGDRLTDYDQAPAGSVAVIPVFGVLMADDGFCGEPGTQTLAARLRAADAHPNIAGLVFHFHTPGGSVDGLELFAGAIAAAVKPTAAWVQSAFSAGYWSASGTDLIVLAGKTAGVGSVGTMITLRDYSARLAAEGVKEHIINATASTGKNTAYYAALQGNYAPLRAETLDPLNQVFLDTVSERRPGIPAEHSEEALSGKVFFGQKAIGHGLADEIGSLEYAAQRVIEMVTAPPTARRAGASSFPSATSKATTVGKKLDKIAALSGKDTVSAEELTAANQELAEAGISAVELVDSTAYAATIERSARAEAADTERQQLTEQVGELTTANAGLTTTNAQLTEQLATANAEVARLGALDGGRTTAPVRAGGASDLDEGGTSADAVIANLPHSKALDGHPLFG